jgi:hypothetical protein
MSEVEWISIVDACPKNLSVSERSKWRQVIINLLGNGRLRAQVSSYSLASFHCSFELFCSLTGKCDCSHSIKQAISRISDPGPLLVPTEFWASLHHVDQADWPKKLDADTVVADWVLGDFASVRPEPLIAEEPYMDDYGHYHYPPESECNAWVHWMLDVKLEHAVVSRVNAQFEEAPVKKAARPTKYDWNGALLNLIAVAEIEALAPDPEKPGAQARIESVIADWFASNSDQVPSEAAIRPYASRVLEAIKAQGNKAN